MRWVAWMYLGFGILAAVSATGSEIDEQVALQRFQAENPTVGWHQTGQHITRVYGSAFSRGATPEDSAFNFVQDHMDMFGVDLVELVPGSFTDGRLTQPVMYNRDTGDYKFTLVYYSQYVDGIPVFRSDVRLLVRNEQEHPLVLVSSGLRKLGRFEISTKVATGLSRGDIVTEGFTAGKRAALHAIPDLVNFTQPETVIWAGLDDMDVEARVALKFVADNFGPGGSFDQKRLYLTDIETGEILYEENAIIDVDGNASGMSTEGSGADFCEAEVLTPMPHLAITSGVYSTFTDQSGDYSITAGGGTVDASVDDGQWFDTFNYVGSEETLSLPATTPADFVFNSSNTSEQVRAQTNGYVHANVVRDFVVTHNPSYPTFSDTDIPCWVNRNDGYCPGNAWYDPADYSSPTGYSINFCQSGSGYPNTAWSSVIYHEFGHHLVAAAGSGQGQYGEGAGDCMSVIILDDNLVGLGFYGSCDLAGTLRNADNSLQYPCSDSIHYCGQLLSGCVWDTRNQLVVTEPSTYTDILGDLMVNSILLHTGTEITPQITVDWLTLDDNDSDIYNGTPHAMEICAGFGAHNMDDVCASITLSPLTFEYPDGRPDIAPPGQPTTFRVNVVPNSGTPVPGTGQLHYSLNGAGYITDAMSQTLPNEYVATLPPTGCFDVYDWYVSAEASGEGTVNDPSLAPATAYQTTVSDGVTTIFEDNFETDQGWTVSAGADTGNWERADPQEVDSSGTITQPEDDHTASGTLCYVTQAAAGSSAGSYDLDGGPTRLTSPAIDLTDTNGATVSYWRWYHISTEWNDELLVEVSDNNGVDWVTVETVNDRETWTYVQWNVSDYVTPTSQVRVRFTADDSPNDSLVEALIDDFMVEALVCSNPYGLGDLNCDGSVNSLDIDPFVLATTSAPGFGAYYAAYPSCNAMLADCNSDGSVNSLDVDPFVGLLN